MAESGGWVGEHDVEVVMRVLLHAGHDPTLAYEITRALRRAGLLVTGRYYVPTAKELYDTYAWLGLRLNGRLDGKVRWVMCRESAEALLRRERDRRVAALQDVAAMWEQLTGERLPVPPPADTVPVVDMDYGTQTGYLLRIPVRIDPAARSPMLEIDSEATMRSRVEDGRA